MKIYLSLILALLLATNTHAEIKAFTKEYIYQASEADSKLTSRTIALKEVKRLLLEEVGTYLETQTEVKNFQLSKDEITVLTAGIVGTEIIAEDWNGKRYYLKAKITADLGELTKAIKELRQDKTKLEELEETKKKSAIQSQQINNLQTELSKAQANMRDLNFKAERAAQNRVNESQNDLDAASWFNAGYAEFNNKQYREAIQSFNNAIKYRPAFYQAYFNRFLLHWTLGNDKDALRDIDLAIKTVSKTVGQQAEYAPTLSMYYGRRANYFLNKGRYKDAMIDLNKAIRLNGDDHQLYIDRGDTYYYLKNENLSLKDYQKAISIVPSDLTAYGRRAFLYKSKKEFDTAINEYSKYINLQNIEGDYFVRNKASAYHERGAIYFSLRKYSEALDDFTKVIELMPKVALGYATRAETYYKLNNYAAAYNDINKAIEFDTSHYFPYLLRGQIELKHMNKIVHSIVDFDKAIELNPNYADVYYFRANAYYKIDNFDKSIADYSKALELNPKGSNIYFSRSEAYSKKGQHGRAIHDLNKAIELVPNDPSYYNARGMEFLEIKKYNDAERDFKKGLSLDPNDMSLMGSLSELYSELRNFDEACQWLQKSIDKGYKDWTYIKTYHTFDNMRSESCYKQIMKDM